jgi:SOS response associated peptidase (SRAP)
LVPLLGKRAGKTKQPYCFEVNRGQLFAFAELWKRWKASSGDWIKTCTILTTTPNAVTSAVHDRMPVILNASDYDLWLDLGLKNTADALEILKPYDALQMGAYPVSSRVNRVQNDDADSRNLLSRNHHRRVSFLDKGSFQRTNSFLNRSTTVGYSACDQRVSCKNSKGFSYNKRTMESAMVPFLPLWPFEESITYVLSTR